MKVNMKLVLVAIIGLSLMMAASPAGAADFSTPQAAAKSLTTAMFDGDVATVQSAVIATPEQSEALAAVTRVMSARKKLIDAAVAKFGEDGKKIEGPMAANQSAEAQHKQIDEAEVKVDGATATLKPAIGDAQHFKQVDGQWKLDLENSPGTDKLVQSAKIMPIVETEFSSLAGEIASGKYKTVDEARNALQMKIQTAMMQSMQKSAATTHPSTAPSGH